MHVCRQKEAPSVTVGGSDGSIDLKSCHIPGFSYWCSLDSIFLIRTKYGLNFQFFESRAARWENHTCALVQKRRVSRIIKRAKRGLFCSKLFATFWNLNHDNQNRDDGRRLHQRSSTHTQPTLIRSSSPTSHKKQTQRIQQKQKQSWVGFLNMSYKTWWKIWCRVTLNLCKKNSF